MASSENRSSGNPATASQPRGDVRAVAGQDQTPEKEIQLEVHLRTRLGSRVRQLRVVCRSDGVVLYGSTRTYHAKQLAQHLVMELTGLPVLANEIEVS